MLPRPSTAPMPVASAVLTPVPPDPTPESSPPAAAVVEPSDALDPSAEVEPSADVDAPADVDPSADVHKRSMLVAPLYRPPDAAADDVPLEPAGEKLPLSLPPPHESSRVIDQAIRLLRRSLFFILFLLARSTSRAARPAWLVRPHSRYRCQHGYGLMRFRRRCLWPVSSHASARDATRSTAA